MIGSNPVLRNQVKQLFSETLDDRCREITGKYLKEQLQEAEKVQLALAQDKEPPAPLEDAEGKKFIELRKKAKDNKLTADEKEMFARLKRTVQSEWWRAVHALGLVGASAGSATSQGADADAGKSAELAELKTRLHPWLSLVSSVQVLKLERFQVRGVGGAQASDAVTPANGAAANALATTNELKVLQDFCRAAGFDPIEVNASSAIIQDAQGGGLRFLEHDANADKAMFVNIVAALVANLMPGEAERTFSGFMKAVDDLLVNLDEETQKQLSRVLRQPRFREIERNWRMVSQIVDSIQGDDVQLDLLDITKEELGEDIRDNANHIMGSALFQRMYVGEFDRFGGIPFSAIVTFFEFDPSKELPGEDLQFLNGLGRLASNCHAPLVGALSPQFFGVSTFDELGDMGDLESMLERPKYGKWNAFRDTHEAAYIGLTLPRYLLRAPYEPSGGSRLNFSEKIHKVGDYLWGNAAALFAQNMIRSFELSKWCQHVRGPEGGGLVRGLPVPTIIGSDGVQEEQPPVDAAIPDYRELQLANAGFIALVSKKDQLDEACFFSAQSAKKAKDFVDVVDTQNAHLVTNLSYTLSVSRVAHYVKRMARDYIGSTADAPYLQNMLQTWLSEYVTTVTNPDDLTLTRYPFKAVTVAVEPKVGPLGWYKCTTSILPHVQFEGMDVELRLEAALGGA